MGFIMVSNYIKYGLKFILKFQFSNDINNLYKENGFSARFIKHAKQNSRNCTIAFILAIFFISIQLPLFSLVSGLISLFFFVKVGNILYSPVAPDIQSHYFSAITEKKDEVAYSFYTEHPELDPQNFGTLEDAINASQRSFEKEGYLYANKQIIGALKLFSMNDGKPCFDVYYNDIIKLKVSKII